MIVPQKCGQERLFKKTAFIFSRDETIVSRSIAEPAPFSPVLEAVAGVGELCHWSRTLRKTVSAHRLSPPACDCQAGIEICHTPASSGGPMLLFKDTLIQCVFGRVQVLGGLIVTDGGGDGLELRQRPSWLEVLLGFGQ